MIELTDEIILKIDDLLDDWASLTIKLRLSVHQEKKIPKEYVNDDIFVEYYNGMKEGKTASQMREICMPKYIRRELSKNLLN